VPTVRVTPSDLDIEVADGETLMDAATRAGLRWPTVCHGEAQCQVCFVKAVTDDLSTPEPDQLEAAGLAVLADRLPFQPGTVRLACQFRPAGDCTVYKRGVRKAPAE
jgi:ferredoxin